MQLQKIALADTRSFSAFFLDYIGQNPSLQKFYNRFPTLQNFKAQLDEKKSSFPPHHREVLMQTLSDQYKNLKVSAAVEHNLSSLSNTNTFTVTTGHQLNIFTGPLYFIYKIVTVINTCKQLKSAYPEYNFVPVYWMASEDHDFEEIKYFSLYGKKYSWETDQSGAVGRFNTEGLDKLLEALPGDTKIFRDAYLKNDSLSDAVRYYVNELFGNEGLVTIDADRPTFKSLFKHVIKEDIFTQATKKIIDATDTALNTLGYKTQVYCRDINFFYLTNDQRNRIEKQGERYTVVNSDVTFTEKELQECIKREPDKFSPNVILRPLYQEIILPNLAYIGGPSEILYWLQLKEVFKHYTIPFPILMPRNFAMIMEHAIVRKFQKTKLPLKDLFEDKNYVFNRWVLNNSSHNLSVNVERSTLHEVFLKLKEKATAIDTTLMQFVGAEEKKALNSLDKTERKLIRAEKRLHADSLRQIEAVKDALFPNGTLQERTDNFLNFYQQDPKFIEHVRTNFDPFDFQFNILSYT